MTTKQKDNKHTHRGTCQVCGRAQAVANGVQVLAKHGYTVEWGFFHGVCRGAHNQPLELEKTITESTIKFLREQYAPAADQRALDLRSGAIEPEFYNTTYVRHTGRSMRIACKREELKFECYETQDKVAQRQIEAAALSAESDARHARSHAEMLVKMIEARHGQPLMPVTDDSLKAGDRVRLFGKKDGVTGTVIEIKHQVARGCGPYMNGRVFPHAHVKDDASDHVYQIPTRSIRQSAIISRGGAA